MSKLHSNTNGMQKVGFFGTWGWKVKQVHTGGGVKIIMKLVKLYLDTLHRPLLTLQYHF